MTVNEYRRELLKCVEQISEALWKFDELWEKAEREIRENAPTHEDGEIVIQRALRDWVNLSYPFGTRDTSDLVWDVDAWGYDMLVALEESEKESEV